MSVNLIDSSDYFHQIATTPSQNELCSVRQNIPFCNEARNN